VTSENSEKIVTIIGGSGFIGRHIVQALAKRGYLIRVACRRPDLDVQLGTPGRSCRYRPMYAIRLVAVCDGATSVINLTGILASHGAQSLRPSMFWSRSRQSRQSGQGQVFIQMSALGADPASKANMRARNLPEKQRPRQRSRRNHSAAFDCV
jgi:NADH dehydrogenase